MDTWKKRLVVLGAAVCTVGTASAFVAKVAKGSAADAIAVLGFESIADWSAAPGVIVGTSQTRTQGNSSLEIASGGYRTFTSRLVGPLGNIESAAKVDLFVPAQQGDPYWRGAVQLSVSAPSVGVYGAYVGQAELGGKTLGAFNELVFPISSDLRQKLSGNYNDLTFTFALNTPQGSGHYLFDNLRITPYIPASSTITAYDIPRILGFESSNDWVVSSGTRTLNSVRKTAGNTSLAWTSSGYSTLTSVPMTTVALVDPNLTLDLYVPEEQPNEWWRGSLAAYVSIPSLGIYNRWLDQKDLLTLTIGQFNKLSFALPSDLQASLNSTGYSDLRISFALNVPQGAGAYLLDNIRLGTASVPPIAQVTAEKRGDIVGKASSGLLNVAYDGENTNPVVKNAVFRVKSEDGYCEPSSTKTCRFLVSVFTVSTEGFSLKGQNFLGMTIQNVNPFRIELGGAQGLSAAVPPDASFRTRIHMSDQSIVGDSSPTGLTIGLTPAGAGMINSSGSFSGDLEGKAVTIAVSLTSDTPLANHMPVAHAGQDFSVSATSGCSVAATLKGSATSDYENNITRLTWRNRGIVRAHGSSPQVHLTKSGRWVFELEALDSFGGATHDEVVVQATLPTSCGAL